MTSSVFTKIILGKYNYYNLSRLTSPLQFSFRSISALEQNSGQNKEEKGSDNRDLEEELQKGDLNDDVQSPLNSRLIRVAIIGVPNAGKSTLINQLTNYEVCPVSKRTHTTRDNQKAVFLENEAQVVFVDTPGLVNRKETKKFSFSSEFVSQPEKSIKSVDLVAILHDLSHISMRSKLDPRVLELLNKHPEKNSILILNKIDLVPSKRKLLDMVRYLASGYVGGRPIELLSQKQKEPPINKNEMFEKTKKRLEEADYRLKNVNFNIKTETSNRFIFTPHEIENGLDKAGWPHFEDVFMISALNGNGVELLKDYFVANAKPSPWMFNEDVVTDVPPAELAVRIVRSKLLDYLPNEMPYKLSPYMEYWETDKSGQLRIVISIKSPNARVTKRLIGTGGGNILKITDETEKILINLLRTQLSLHVNVLTEDDKKHEDK